MYKCGALVVKGESCTKQLLTSLKVAASIVCEVLYVPLVSRPVEEPLTDLATRINQLYFTLSKINPSIDLRVVLPSHHDNTSLPSTPLSHKVDTLLSPEESFKTLLQLPEYQNISNRFTEGTSLPQTIFQTLSPLPQLITPPLIPIKNVTPFSDVALGGTFDCTHNGHNLLLTMTSLIATNRILIGITDEPLLKTKILTELIKPVDERMQQVESILRDIKPHIKLELVPITDIYGPTAWDESLNCLVLTPETMKGGEMINKERQDKGLSRLEVYSVEMIQEGQDEPATANLKLGSTELRKRQLGVYRTPKIDRCLKERIQGRPYLIGLTGGSASGKSSITKRLVGLKGYPIDCDKLGHLAYKQGSEAYDKLISEFGSNILQENKEIHRKALGAIVFSDKTKLTKLNEIVWPEIWKLAMKEVDKAAEQGYQVCIIDAAVLLQAKWDEGLNEVWGAIIPVEEAVKRVMERDGTDEERARKRIASQTSNKEVVDHSHVVFCTLWDYDYTYKQVEKAWQGLMERLNVQSNND